MEQSATLARFHQFDKMQLDWTVLNPMQKGTKLLMVNITHQHCVDFNLLEPGSESGISAIHHLAELIFTGNEVKLTGIKAVDTDIDCRQSGVALIGSIACHSVAIGGDR